MILDPGASVSLAYKERVESVVVYLNVEPGLVSPPQGYHQFSQSKLMTTQQAANEVLRRPAPTTVATRRDEKSRFHAPQRNFLDGVNSSRKREQ